MLVGQRRPLGRGAGVALRVPVYASGRGGFGTYGWPLGVCGRVTVWFWLFAIR